MQMIVSPNSITRGTVRFRVRNAGTVRHQFVVMPARESTLTPGADGRVPEVGVLGALRRIAPDRTAVLNLRLDDGHYELFCNLPGHYARGLHVSFTVG